MRCRQAAHRFGRQRPRHAYPAAGAALRFAYADPPYPGLARRYYRQPEVDHRELIDRLVREFPDGWALSTSTIALHDVLALCPKGVRVNAWFRGERPTVSYRPLVAWEPVITYGGRPYRCDVDARRIDALVHVARPRRTGHTIIGGKPAAFCWWLFGLLGARPGDELADLFPGSGGVTRAWELFSSAESDASGSPAGATRPGDPRDASFAAARDASPCDRIATRWARRPRRRVVAGSEVDASPGT